MSTQSKKILYVITKSNFGGAQRYVFDLASHAQRLGYDVVVALGGDGELVRRLKENDIQTIVIHKLQRDVKIFGDFISFVKMLKLLRYEKPDVLHLNSSKIGLMGAIATRLHNLLNAKRRTQNATKIIFTAHGWAFTEARSLPSQLTIKFLQWLTVLLSHTTIAVSEKTKSEMNMPFAKRKIRVIYNGICDVQFKERGSARKEIGEKYDTPQDTFWVGTIAELHKNKGLEHAIETIAILEETSEKARPFPTLKNKDEKGSEKGQAFSYIIIGEGKERENLLKLARERNLEDKVFLVGEKEDAAVYLKAFDILLLPSIKEGLPYTILEAGAAGLPVIASRVGGIPEIIVHKESGILTKPKEADAIAQALETLLTDDTLRKKYGENLKRKVASEFSLQKMLKQTTSLYS